MNERTVYNSLVKKKWGHEYIIYRNEHLAITYLKINYNESTSLHAHLTKDTGLIVLDGIAKVSFLNNSSNLKGLDKIAIFRNRMHSTTALSKRGATLFEVECPEDKNDLVRFQDKYGRENQPYEGKDSYEPIPEDFLVIPYGCKHLSTRYINGSSSCKMCIFSCSDNRDIRIIDQDFETVFVILYGGIVTKDNKVVVSVGNVISAHNLDVLLQKLDLAPGTVLMRLWKNYVED